MVGVKDVQGGYVRTGPQGMYGRGHEHPGGGSCVRSALDRCASQQLMDGVTVVYAAPCP